jgi:hypothetical protein
MRPATGSVLLLLGLLCGRPAAGFETSTGGGSTPAPPRQLSETPSGDGDDNMVCITPDNCISKKPGLKIDALSPPAGPLSGETLVVLVGSGYRNFGSLMRCRFGSREAQARLHVEPGFVADPYNHTMISCTAPASPTPFEQDVAVEVSLNGEEYSASGRTFRYYRHPVLSSVSPERGSASKEQIVTLTRSTATNSGGWSPVGAASTRRCRFEAIVQPTGKRQVQYKEEVNATVADATEIQCASPQVGFVAPVRIELSLNGQQYSSGGPLFTYEDNWHSPAQSGVPPGGRHGHAGAIVGSIAYYFGGEDGSFDAPGAGYVDDFWALHLDAMHDFYPSDSARDLAWQKLSLSTGGDPPSPRSYATLTAWSTTLLLFGGSSSMWGDMHNSTYEFNTLRGVWAHVPVSGGPVTPRSGHTAVLCSLSTNCATSDGRPRLFVFGGWGFSPCEGNSQCLVHRDDLLALDLNSMSWALTEVNAEQPKPPARKGHSATLVNGTSMIIFGGSAWVADPEADNSYGYTTKQVNDLWRIDVSGADEFTWRPVYAIGDRPGPREGHSAALVAGRYLVIHGGYEHNAGYRNDTYVLDTSVDPMVWTQPTLTGDRPCSRHGHSLLPLVDNELLSFGGASPWAFEHDVHVLQLGVGNEGHYPDLAGTHG